MIRELVASDPSPRSAEDAENLLWDRSHTHDHNEPWSSRTVPRRREAGAASVTVDALTMQPHNMERRKEAFLEHLKQKFPHHASAIMGHQDRLREQLGGLAEGESTQAVASETTEQRSQVALESLEAMSEGDAPGTFTRGSRARASLPAVKSGNHTKDRSLGVLFLQYGEETRQILMPSEVMGLDAIQALFVSAFPQQLSLKILESPKVAIYVRDRVRNVYYELTDIRSVTSHSCLKVYHKDPAQAFNHSSRNSNGDVRIPRERLYAHRPQPGGQSMVHTLPPPHNPMHVQGVQGSMSPPTARSMPSSPSRLVYSSRAAANMPGGATLPRERLSSVPPSRSATASSSAILERRDVKPDEDTPGKSLAPYVDPYALAEARLSVASSQGDVPDGPAFVQRRSPSKSVGSYSEAAEPQSVTALYRQKSRKYSENQHVNLASKTPPPSPQRVGEVRMIDLHPGQSTHMMAQGAERASPVRRSFRKNSNGTLEGMRGTVTSPVFTELPPGHGDRPFQGLVNTDHQSKRMKAMEQQLASLTGLVQHALFKGANVSGVIETSSEKPLSASPGINSGGVSPVAAPKSLAFKAETTTVEATSRTRTPAVSSALSTFQKNVSNIREQLLQLRQMQLQNQDTMKSILHQAEEELAERIREHLQPLEDPVHRQRCQVDEDRHRYLAMEESVLLQLGELEKHVESLKRDSMSVTTQRPVTLQDVEDGAVSLRKVGEALAALKGEFPALQLKMRSVLRVEVEAVRFLKEEPHKMDNMLKRVKALTETLSSLRRSTTEGSLNTEPVEEKSENPSSTSTVRDSPTPQPRSPAKAARSELTPSSPVLVQRARSSPVNLQPCQHSVGLTHHPSPPLTPTHGRDAPTVAKVSPRSRDDSPILQKKEIPCIQESTPNASSANEAVPTQDTETTTNTGEEKAKEKQQAKQEAGLEMEQILLQAQANLMKAIPNLEVNTKEESRVTNPTVKIPDEVDCPRSLTPPPEAATPAEPVVDKPVQERVHRAPKEKPHRASVDKLHANLETGSKSPPPPPPRRFYPAGAGLTTGRSGEVIYTSRKELTPAQQEKEDSPAPPPSPQRVPPEVKPKPQTPPPISASALRDEEEDEDEDKIIAELQVFEKCPVRDLEPRYVVDLTTHELPDRELEPSFSLSSYDPKSAAHHGEDGKLHPNASPSTGVIYFITGTAKTSSPNIPAKAAEVQKESSEGIVSLSKVAHPNASGFSQRQNVLMSHDLTLDLPKSVVENPMESSDAQQIFVNLPKTHFVRTEDNLTVFIPKQANGIVENRQEKQVVIPPPENLSMVTVKSSSIGSEVGTLNFVDAEASEALEDEQQVVRRTSRGRAKYTEDASLSPDLPGEEAPPPPDNIAFMITKTKVQALSKGEYQQLVSSKGQDVETVQVGADTTSSAAEDVGSNKKPVIIVFDEPMDIHQAYKRLSTIFECEEELDRMLTKECINEENEEAEEEEPSSHRMGQVKTRDEVDQGSCERKIDDVDGNSGSHLPVLSQPQSHLESPDSVDRSKMELSNDAKQDAKKKFKFKFPKKQLAAIGQALRTGTKTGKKTLQVVVYEDEEEPDGTVREAREAKRFEIKSQVDATSLSTFPTSATLQTGDVSPQSFKGRTKEICTTTYKTLNSLEETIKQLETTISDMDPTLSPELSRKDSKTKRTAGQTAQEEGSPSKRPTPQVEKPHKSSQRKKVKAQSTSRTSSSSSTSSSSTKQSSSSSASSSRISSPKSRQTAESVEKSGKSQKLQDSQRQFRQVVLL